MTITYIKNVDGNFKVDRNFLSTSDFESDDQYQALLINRILELSDEIDRLNAMSVSK